jgi:hypothetical protein
MRKAISGFLAVVIYSMGFLSMAQDSIVRRAPGGAVNGIYNYTSPGGFGTARAKIMTNGTLRVQTFGDSLVTGQLSAPLFTWLVNSYGFAGFHGVAGASYGNNTYVYTNTAAAAAVSGDFTSWFASYYPVANGESVGMYVTNTASGTSTGVKGNIVFLDYIEENGANTIKVQTNNGAGGAFADFQTGINANNSGAKHGVALRWTNSFSALMNVRIAATSAGTAAKVLQFGVENWPSQGVVINMFAQGGLGLDQFLQVPTNITMPILRAQGNDLVISKWLDGSPLIASDLAPFNTLASNAWPNANWVWVGANPIISGTLANIADVIVGNSLFQNDAIQNGRSYFDAYYIFGSTNYAVAQGWLSAAFDPHPTASGDQMTADLFKNWCNLFTADSTLYGGLSYTYGNNYSTNLTNAIFKLKAHPVGGGEDINLLSIAGNTISSDQSFNIAAPTVGIGFDLLSFFPPQTTKFATFNGDIECYQGGTFRGLNGAGLIIGTGGSLQVGPNPGAVTNILTASANLDFPSTGPVKTSDLNIAVAGLSAIDTNATVLLGVPSICEITNTFYTAFPSNGAVWVRFHNLDTNTAQNPGPAVFKVTVMK